MAIYNGPVWPGKPYPLGAKWDGHGVNFALFSENATSVELCLFNDKEDKKEYANIPFREVTDHVWHAYLPGIVPGQLYAYRVDGPYDPDGGWRFNANKLLIDPYAKAITEAVYVHNNMFAFPLNSKKENADTIKDRKDSAPVVPKGIVIDDKFDWRGDKKHDTPLHNSIIYELHVKGFTAQHPELPEELRGTYKGLASKPVINYFKELGVTAVELMPIHHFVHDKFLLDKGLRNYWGYNSIGYFAPHSEYAAEKEEGNQVKEFKEMVKTFHNHGIEVILDVVYNHTAEGNHLGPTLSFRGIDNHNYYRLMLDTPKYYMDYTGTGNTLNMLTARTLQLVMDSLRYWVTEMHVDGFRFDLASSLARGLYEVGKLSTFLDTIHQDPIISQVKLIAEPWDIGEGGYQVGNFPVLWAEWNGKYRDSVRKFWRGDESQVAELAFRLSGSSDLYKYDGKQPSASINFVTSHDGFTMNDLVSYNAKHNEINGENNQDGDDNNNNWNHGVEGPADDKNIIELRERQKRNFLSTLLFSQGVPMISHGDEYGRTQNGNNNAYCQDNEIAWMNWNWSKREKALFEFTKRCIAIRHSQPVMHRRKYFQGRKIHGSNVHDIRWFNIDGTDMTDEEWNTSFIRCMGMLLNGEAMDEVDEMGRPIKDDILYLMVNSYWEPILFTLPVIHKSWKWEILVDTYHPAWQNYELNKDQQSYLLKERSLVLLRKLK